MVKRIIFFFFLICFSGNLFAKAYRADTQKSYFQFLPLLQPGDSLILADGVWNDFRIVFTGNGTGTSSITLCAENPGKVIISGKSSLRLSGSFLVVKDLIFKNGYSPDAAVISFKVSESEFAVNSRITQCVIDSFNKPERFAEDNYVALWGRHNRVDHCYLGGKTNAGVTMFVFLDGEHDRENHHLIDYNYFGTRPRLGSNGGETFRIGGSEVSKQSSFTVLEHNYFEHCNGETEVISVKASDNIVRNNTLFECEGSIVLRHGDRNTVSGNFILGNGKPETGGIRVINAEQNVYNNYMYGLTGNDFRGSLVVMDGLLDSPLNRYDQVRDSKIIGNVWINCESPWLLGFPFRLKPGESVMVPPVNTEIAYNIVYSDVIIPLIQKYDSITGITFKDNITNLELDEISEKNFSTKRISLKNFGGILLPDDNESDVASILNNANRHGDPAGEAYPLSMLAAEMASPENCGPTWYNRLERNINSAKVIKIKPGKNTLAEAVYNCGRGDTILFEDGVYFIDQELEISRDIIFSAKPNLKTRPVIKAGKNFKNESLIKIVQGGSISINGLTISGSGKDGILNAIQSDRNKMSQAYKLIIRNCILEDFKDTKAAIIKGTKGTFADTVSIRNSILRNSRAGISYSEETADNGIYNAEYIILENTVFDGIEESAIDLYRGGTDESTFGPFLNINHCVFNSVAGINGKMLKLTGVQHAGITNSIFSNSPGAVTTVNLDGKYNSIKNCIVYNAGRPESINSAQIHSESIYDVRPFFRSDGSFLLENVLSLGNNSELIGIQNGNGID